MTHMRRPVRVRRRVLPRFYVFCAAFLALIAFLVWLALPKGTAAVRKGSIGESVHTQAVVVRTEKVTTSKTYPSQIVPLKQEGQSVQAGDPVVEIYTSSYSEKIRTELRDVRARIKEAQEHDLLASLNSASLKELDSRIAEAVTRWTAIVRGETDKGLVKTQAELSALLRDRQELLRRAAVQSRDLQALYEQENNLTLRIAGWRNEVAADTAGIVSFQFTGLEEVVQPGTLDQFTVSNVRTLLKGDKPPQTAAQKSEKPLFRVVSERRVQLVCIVPREGVSLAVDQSVSVRLPGQQESVSARVMRLTTERRERLAVLDVPTDVLPLLNLVQVSVDVGGEQSGLLVPEEALRPTADGGYSVESVDGQTLPVRLLGRDGRRALIEPVTPGTLSEGMRVKTK